MKQFNELRQKMPPGEHIKDFKVDRIPVMIHKEKGKFVAYVDGDEWVEFKVSFESQGKWFLLQIRPYQDIDRYDILLIDADMKPTIYKLSKEKMKELVDKFGDVCHGTKMSNQDNTNLEYRITLTREIIQTHF